jgi:putative transposase
MPRTARKAPGGVVFHVINRGVGRRCIFDKDEDFSAFERVMVHALTAHPVRLLGYCMMPNHFHLLLWPDEDGQMGRFMHRLSMTHTRRWQEHYHRVGEGHLYQGRFKSFPVQDDRHFLIVARYVERNALRAGLVMRAEHWRWSSLWRRAHPAADAKQAVTLSDWPVPRPTDWVQWVNEPQTQAQVERLRHCIAKGRPFGDDPWQAPTTAALGLESSHRRTGRPTKVRNEQNP